MLVIFSMATILNLFDDKEVVNGLSHTFPVSEVLRALGRRRMPFGYVVSLDLSVRDCLRLAMCFT